jgi:hypothetical protein
MSFANLPVDLQSLPKLASVEFLELDPRYPRVVLSVAALQLEQAQAARDLIVHGLTNSRSFIAVAAILGLLAQSGLSPREIAARFGIEFDVVVAGLSLVRFVVLVVVSFIAAVGVIALLSVLVSIVTYYGFSMYRTAGTTSFSNAFHTRRDKLIRLRRSSSASWCPPSEFTKRAP